MIEAELVFDGDKVLFNDGEFTINIEVQGCDVYNRIVGYMDSFETLEQAIKYGREN